MPQKRLVKQAVKKIRPITAHFQVSEVYFRLSNLLSVKNP